MTLRWTSEQVLALSPDASSTKNGKALATVAKWPLLGHSDQAVWGECKGSGKNPYRTQIDLREPAFRCSCPSRKFPCKHALGLFLLLTEQTEAFSADAPPDWVAEWLEKRSQTTPRKQTKSAKAAADPAAQAKRAEQRAAKVEAGLADLSQWMQDLMRQGLATLPNQPYSFWDQTAARLVDAQAPGLARRVRALASIPHSGEGWPDRMLSALGQLHLLVQSYGRLASLAPDLQAEVRSQIGWPQTQDDLRLRAEQADPLVVCLSDTWQVLGKVVTEEENLRVQRVWLWGRDHDKAALALSFAHGRNPLDVSLAPGDCFCGKLIFYPGTGVQRAFVESREESVSPLFQKDLGFEQIEAAIVHYAEALSQNPWLGQFPLTLRQVFPRYYDDAWWLQDAEDRILPLSPQFSQGWELMAVGGGYPLTVFGEWDGATLIPLSLWTDQQFIPLGE
ncbi:MAG: SWIM zinc finger family protein [Leptolyngbyaceae cyanobacterium MO_188.B28]|nr:SWIM zinc finger family protein [Leptolyngbyaceae cyanobacterium MO_188.B28]